jgi:carboxyl-terminal processing protease
MNLRPLTLLGITASMVSGVGLGVLVYRAWFADPPPGPSAETLERALREVQASYVIEVDESTLLNNALRGMMRDLDRHSVFLDAGQWETLQSETSGNFGGIGVELGYRDGAVTIVAPMIGTPAAAAGLRAGDQVIEIDHEPVNELELPALVERMRGAAGSTVHLRIGREGRTAPIDFDLTREIIHINSVDARLLEPGYGYVRINQFQLKTGDEFSAALTQLQQDSESPMRGLVLDLRNNPGGILQASVEVADTLLTGGMIVYTEGRQPSSHIRFKATRDDMLDGAPIAVLINGGSASAAEVVAGALQDHHRAVLIGSRSYGKGSVQSVLQVGEDAAIKLTTAYYYTPSGRNIHEKGIEPDIVWDTTADADPSADDAQLLARALDVLRSAQSAPASDDPPGTGSDLQARR